MANYKLYTYDTPSSNYKDYMPEYTKYYYTKPADNYSDKKSAYSAEINGANNKLNNAEMNKPGTYNSAYTNRINELLDNLANRKFSYDVNGDALYQQYKNQYMTQGKQAMQDTMAQASLATGGYGNSYAAVAGNQAYQSYLDQLNNKIPELYQLAYDKYRNEGTDLQNLYYLYANQDSQDYAKYRDKVADYQADRSFYDTQVQNLRTMGQNLWGQNWSNYWNAADRTDTNWQNALNAAMTKYSQDWGNYQWAEEQTQHNYEYATSEDQWASEQAESARQFNETQDYNYWKARLDDDYNRYKTDQDNATSRYSADRSAEASMYGADRSYDANKYKADNSGSSGSSSGGSSSSGSGSSNSDVANEVKKFNAGIMSLSEYTLQKWGAMAGGDNVKKSSYKNYVKDKINKNTSLSVAARAQLMSEYGLW